jgi:pimeloyl-ACP methyl ester carboxylesterase
VAPPGLKKLGLPQTLQDLIDRFDRSAFDLPADGARIRRSVGDDRSDWDAVLDGKGARLKRASGTPDASLAADAATWKRIRSDVTNGMQASSDGRLQIRQNLNLAIGFLAATAGSSDPGRLRVRQIETEMGDFSIFQAGSGEPLLLLHGLGGTKASFLPTIAALAQSHRLIAVDLLGFGDSDKPIAAPYDAKFFALSTVALLDALEIETAHVLGHSMGGRVALELGFSHAERTRRLVAMTPSLASLRERRLAPYLRLIRPELGLLQVAPRPAVEIVMRRLIPGADTPWGATAIDEFVRGYTSARGRAALYAAARQIYLEKPNGQDGFWTRLETLAPESLFIWGRRDRLVPTSFVKHVERALPAAQHVELDCGHIPQLELPNEAHAAIHAFLESGRATSTLRSSGSRASGSRAA